MTSGTGLPPTSTMLSSLHKSGVALLFERNLKIFLAKQESPSWDASLNLFDSLTRLIAIADPESELRYSHLLLQLVYEETPIEVVQSDMKSLLRLCPLLREHFAGFLDAPTKSKLQCNAAREYVLALTGLPRSVKKSEVRPLHVKGLDFGTCFEVTSR